VEAAEWPRRHWASKHEIFIFTTGASILNPAAARKAWQAQQMDHKHSLKHPCWLRLELPARHSERRGAVQARRSPTSRKCNSTVLTKCKLMASQSRPLAPHLPFLRPAESKRGIGSQKAASLHKEPFICDPKLSERDLCCTVREVRGGTVSKPGLVISPVTPATRPTRRSSL
jgi:hypothetical protein